MSRHDFRYALLALAMSFARPASAQGTDWIEAARKFKKTAVEHLRKSQQSGAEETKAVRQALYALGVARRLLENYKPPVPDAVRSELEEINSLIYWAHKFTKIDAAHGLPSPAELPAEPGETREEQAGEHFERVQAYERAHPNDHFVLSVFYFEVADRFQGTPASLKAQRLSLDHQRRSGTGGAAPPPGGTPDPGAPPAAGFDTADGTAALETLVTVLKSGAGAEEKAKACAGYRKRFPGGDHAGELELIEKVYGAKAYDERTNAWIRYWTEFPAGILGAEARSALRHKELAIRVRLLQHMLQGEMEKVKTLGRGYLNLHPRGPAAPEVRSLLPVLNASPGPARTRLARKHIRTHDRGTFTNVLKTMLEKWLDTEEKAAFRALLDRFEATKSAPELLRATGEYLGAHSKGKHAAEVKMLRPILALENVRARLVAARNYLEKYQGGGFVARVREFEKDLAGKRETELYRVAKAVCGDRGKSYEAMLAACERYSAEFPPTSATGQPEGTHAGEVGGLRAKVVSLVKDEAAAHEKLVAELGRTGGEALPPGQGVATAAGVGLCDAFVKKYPGGVHVSEVLSRRSALSRRLTGEKEEVAFRALEKKLAQDGLTRVAKAAESVEFLRKYKGGKRTREITARLKELASGPLFSHGAQVGPMRAAVFSADSGFLVACDASASHRKSGLWVWKLPEARLVARYRPRPRFTVRSALLVTGSGSEDGGGEGGGRTPTGTELWLGEESGGLMVWDASRIAEGLAQPTGRYRLGAGPLVSVSTGENEVFAVTASLGDSKARLWSPGDWTIEQNFPCPGGVSAAAMSRAGDVIAVGTRDGSVTAFAVDTGEELWYSREASGPARGEVGSVAFSPNGMYLASSSDAKTDGTVSLFNVSSGEKLWSVEEGSAGVVFVDNETVLTGPSLREAGTSHVVAECGGEGALAASPDGTFALTTDEERTGILWYLPALLW